MFVNLHCHTARGSLLDSILTVEQMADFCEENGQTAIAITDHGYMSNFVDFYKACKAKNIRPILGCEIYEVDDDQEKNDTKDKKQPRYHLILLAKNKNGLHNLFKIVSYGCTEGMYKKPRISIDRIKENGWGEDIICLTACQAGRLSRLVCSYEMKLAKEWIDKLQSTFDYTVVELQSHDTDAQYEANYRLLEFAKRYSLPYTITCDAHYLSKSDAEAHSVFVKIGQDREVGESYEGCYLQTESEIYYTLRHFSNEVVDSAIKESEHIASMIEDFDIGLENDNQMPIINIPPEYSSHEEYLRYLVYSTFDKKFGYMSKEDQQARRDRIEMELPVIEALGYVDYFLMCQMLLNEARKRHIPLGPARGSAAGCLCLYMLDVTQIDSVLWDLDFSRFANLGRKSLADVDVDISKRRRREVVDIAAELFGKENVAPICTFNTLSTKVAIRDIGKVLNEDESSPYFGKIPYSMRNEVASSIPTVKTLDDLGQEVEKDVLLKDLMSKSSKLQKIYDEFPLWFEYVMKLEGLPKSMGRHAAGTLITPRPVVEYMPLCYDKDKNVIAQLEMHGAMDDLKCIKMDFLGLKTLDIVDDTLKSAGLTWDDIAVNKLDFTDKKVYEEIYQKGNCVAVFQMESSEAQTMCINAKASDIDDIIAINAANRPGTKDSFPEYCRNKIHPDQIKVVHDDLRQVLGKTYCILLYQEQALAMFRYAGFPETEVDNARRAIGKKKADVMSTLEKQFREGLFAKGWDIEQIDSMWTLILKQSGYSFNKSHACAYGILSYITAYLKVHYPVEFMAACLTCDSGNLTKQAILIDEARRIGVKVLPPNINKSNLDFTPLPSKNSILFGLLAIKGIGENTINNILSQRPFKSFDEYLEKIKDKTATIALIKAGAFTVNRKVELMKSYANKIIEKKEYKEVSTIPSKAELLLKWGIDTNDYKDGRKLDKDHLRRDYNLARQIQFDSAEKERYEKAINDFRERYAQDPWLWEFEALSMFVTSDPLEFAYDKIRDFEQVETDTDAVLIGVIVGIQRKKDRNGQLFCYIQMYTPTGIKEAICWASTMKNYIDLIKNGTCIAIYGRKTEGGNIIVNEMKDYRDWLKDKNLKHEGVNA